MRNWLRRFLTAVIGAGIVTTALVAPASTASAAYPTCSSFSNRNSSDGYLFAMPSIGSNSHNFECQLQLNDGYHGGGTQLAVWVLQGSLNGCHQAGLVEDGKYGPNTRNAVGLVSASVGLDPPASLGVYTPNGRIFAIHWLGRRTVGGEVRTVCRHYWI